MYIFKYIFQLFAANKLISEWLLQPLCTILCSDPVLQKLTALAQVKKTLPFPASKPTLTTHFPMHLPQAQAGDWSYQRGTPLYWLPW